MSTEVMPASDPLDELVGRLGVRDDPRIEWRPSPGGYVARFLGLGIIVAVFILAPHVAPDTRVNALAIALVFGIIALSMNVLIGYTGQVSLGHAAFVGIGAFTSGFIIIEAELPWLAGVAGGVLSGILVALTLGGIALRLRGLYLALVTIAYGALAQSSLFQITAFTGGGGGRAAPRPGFALGDISYYYLCLLGLVLVWFLDWRLTASRPGRAIEALRDDERVAASWGISITGYKLLAFIISGAMAGFAGALFASIEQVVSPGSFEFAASLTFVLMTVVGGLRSRPGVVIGGFVFALLPVLLSEAERVWGHGHSINSLPPKAVQFVIGAGLAAGGVAMFRLLGRSRNPLWLLTSGLLGAVLVPLGVWVALRGAWISDFNIFGDFLTPLMEPVIGALLLIGTLTLFPGGIAEQNKELFRWLSFGPFHEKEPGATASGGGH